ncbi:MAG: DUF4340 domain-containing protein [Polyangiaceae bacterium]
MQWRAHVTSIGLTIAAAGALAYAYVDRGSVTESEKKAREGSVFVAWHREELARIVVDHGDGEHIVLERAKDDAGDAEWWMRAPLAERADNEACDKLASAFELAAVVRKVAPGVSVPGLDAPRAKGEADMGGVTYRFALGGDAPTPAGAAYLRVDGVGTVVVARELVTALLQGADTYRSRFFVPYVSVQLAGLEVNVGGADLRIERADDVSFKLVPSGLRASRGRLDAIWGALGEMRAEAFVSDAVAGPLVANPSATITMTPLAKSAVPGVIRVGEPCPGNGEDVVVVRDAPTRLSACAPRGILTGLGTTEADLIDANLFAAHADEVAELRIETLGAGPAAALELARKEGGWREKAPVERDLMGEDADAAAALVAAIATAEGGDPRKSDEPFVAKGRVTLRRADGGVAEAVELGASDAEGGVTVRRAFDGARLRVSAAVARKLTPRAVALRGHEVWAPRIEGVPIGSIETRCDGVEQKVTHDHDGETWTMLAPKGFTVDNTSVLDLVDTVTRAKVDSWSADADDGHFGFAAPGCFVALTLQIDGGERVARIELGSSGEGGVYARTNDSPAVFVAPASLRDRARAWLVDLHGFAPGNVDAVVLERNGERLSYSADGGANEATDAVVSAANVLRADSVVHLGPPRAEEGLAHPSLVITLRGGGGARRIVLGGETAADGKTRFARVDGVDATFAVERERVKAFFDRF